MGNKVLGSVDLPRSANACATFHLVRAEDGHDYVVVVGGRETPAQGLVHAAGCEACMQASAYRVDLQSLAKQ